MPEKSESSGSGETTPPPKEVQKIAEDAVKLLDVKEFIKTHLDPIFTKLEECEGYATAAPVNGDMMFIALSLPVINGVIHIASNRKDLKKAMDWVTQKWREPHNDPDPISILSALTLIYVVMMGWRKFKDGSDDERRETWRSILNRVKKLSEEMES